MMSLQENCGLTKMNKNIIVYGAGGIGSLYGALLSRKNSVTLVGRKPHITAIKRKGLKIKGIINKRYNIQKNKFQATTTLTKIPKGTILLIAVKVYDLEKALLELKKKIKQDTIIVLLQNGSGNEAIAQRILPHTRTVRAIFSVPVTFLKPGEIRYSGKATIYFPATTEGKYVANLFNIARIETKIAKNFDSVVWTKLIINCVFNPLTTVLQIKNNEVKKLKPLAQKIIAECCAVAEAEGILLEHIEEKMDQVIENAGDNISSMLQDVMKGKKTEIDFLNGRIVELAKKHGIPVPYNEMLVRLVKFKEQNYNFTSFKYHHR